MPEGLLAPGTILLFGEIHGTRELPAFFGEAVCHASAAHDVVVGLEIPGSESERVSAFLRSSGASADRDAVLAGPFWTDGYQDGRRSEAMARLLERLRVLRAIGRHVDVMLFDVEPSESGPDRDERMAQTIMEYQRAHAGPVLMAYMGNVHARTTIGVPWNPKLKPLGWYLSQHGLRVRSLDSGSPGGSAWMCYVEDASDPRAEQVCGPHALSGSSRLPAHAGIWLHAMPSPEGFDGVYAVPALSSSPPAASAR